MLYFSTPSLLDNIDSNGQQCLLLEQEVRYLSRRHIGYRVRPAYFEVFGKVLIDTFAHAMGERFTDAHREAWRLVFRLVADQMIRVIESDEEGIVSFAS